MNIYMVCNTAGTSFGVYSSWDLANSKLIQIRQTLNNPLIHIEQYALDLDAKWASNPIQFQRLLGELATVGLTTDQLIHLQEVMDLDKDGVLRILDRAQTAWDYYKDSL